MVRKAKDEDVGRIAEILVFVKRINFFPIFQDEQYSFKELNVVDIVKEVQEKVSEFYVYDDGVIKAVMHIQNEELVTLYVDSFFQNQGIGSKLLKYAIDVCDIQYLWALEKNTGAICFYLRNGMYITDEKKLEEDTTEYLVKLKRLA